MVGSNMDKIYIVMDYIEHDLKALMETMKESFSIGLSPACLSSFSLSHAVSVWNCLTTPLAMNHDTNDLAETICLVELPVTEMILANEDLRLEVGTA